METNGGRLTLQKLTHQNTFRPSHNAELVYRALVKEMTEILSEKGKNIELTPQNKKVIGQVALWYANDGRFEGDLWKGIMLRGGVGTGKTLIVKALMKVILHFDKLNARFIHAVDLQSIYAKQNEEEINILKERVYTIIDDFGVESVETKFYGNIMEPFNDLFDCRYRRNLLSILTTNLLPSDIRERYGDRIIDRFKETINDIVLDYPSLRK